MKDLVEHLAQRSAVFLGEPPELAQHQAALDGAEHRIEHRRSESSPASFHLATETSPNATCGRAWLVTVPAVLEADSCKPGTELFTLDSQALSGSCGAFGTQQQNTEGSESHYERSLKAGISFMKTRYGTVALARIQGRGRTLMNR